MDRLALARAFFSADFETGVVSWRADPDPALFAHDGWRAWHMRERAGKPVVFYEGSGMGHRSAKVRHAGRNVTLLAHRIVWALAYNEYPALDLDHINNDPTDNRLANLRAATRGQNATNGRRVMAGLKGAYRAKDGGRWFSMVWAGKRLAHLGMFDTPEAAHDAWARAKADIANGFFNPGYASVFD